MQKEKNQKYLFKNTNRLLKLVETNTALCQIVLIKKIIIFAVQAKKLEPLFHFQNL